MRAFVSFADGAEGDRKVASLLIESLRRQRIEVFDFTRPSGYYVGTELLQKIRQQMSLTQVCVFLATENSTSPERQVIVEEVRTAISLSKSEGLLLYPVLLAERAPRREWVSVPELSIHQAFSRESRATALLTHFLQSSILHYDGALYFREQQWNELLEKCSPLVRVILSSPRPLQYYGPFDHILRSLEYEVLHSTNTERIDVCVSNICQKLGVVYQPRIAHHPRLPLRTKMMEELREFQDSNTLQEHSLQSLLDFVSNFEADRKLANWDECLGCIEGAIQVLRSVSRTIGKSVSCPYLQVVKGICLFQMGKLDSAHSVCQLLLEKGFACEGNVTGLLGRIFFERGDYTNAIAQASKSIDEAERTDGGPAHLARVDRLRMAFSILERSQNEGNESNQSVFNKCREIIRDEWVFDDLESVELMSDRERIECNRIQAHRHFFLKEFSEAKGILERLICETLHEFKDPSPLPEPPNYKIPSQVLAYLDREEVLIGDPLMLRVSQCGSSITLSHEDMLVVLQRAESGTVSVLYLDDDIAILNARVLLALSLVDQARNSLMRFAELLQSPFVWRFLAALEDVQFQSPSRALDILLKSIGLTDQRHPIDLILASWLSQRLGSNDRSLELANEAISNLRDSDRLSRNDEYYLGFAYFLVGHSTLASHYFEQSMEHVWYNKYSW